MYIFVHLWVNWKSKIKHIPFYSRLWLSVDCPGLICSHLLRGKQKDVHDVLSSMWLTSESRVEGSQQSVLSLWAHFSREAQLGHHVTKGWLWASYQFHHLLSLKGTGDSDTIQILQQNIKHLEQYTYIFSKPGTLNKRKQGDKEILPESGMSTWSIRWMTPLVVTMSFLSTILMPLTVKLWPSQPISMWLPSRVS